MNIPTQEKKSEHLFVNDSCPVTVDKNTIHFILLPLACDMHHHRRRRRQRRRHINSSQK